MMNKTALVLEGGALRGIFTAGVVDCFLDNNINFDYVCGVSAGACNTFAYVGSQRGYIKKCLMQKNPFNSFYGLPQMIESHKLVDLDKIFYEYTTTYNFDFDAFINSKTKWEMVVSNLKTGKPEYINSNDIEEAKLIGKASCSIPAITAPVEINNNLYLDGGVCDSIPLKHVLDLGYEKIVVILTRKKGNYSSTSETQKMIYHRLYGEYPNFIETAIKRSEMYQDQIKLCEELFENNKIVLIRPTYQEISNLESNENELSLFYYHGYTKAKDFIDEILSLNSDI